MSLINKLFSYTTTNLETMYFIMAIKKVSKLVQGI